MIAKRTRLQKKLLREDLDAQVLEANQNSIALLTKDVLGNVIHFLQVEEIFAIQAVSSHFKCVAAAVGLKVLKKKFKHFAEDLEEDGMYIDLVKNRWMADQHDWTETIQRSMKHKDFRFSLYGASHEGEVLNKIYDFSFVINNISSNTGRFDDTNVTYDVNSFFPDTGIEVSDDVKFVLLAKHYTGTKALVREMKLEVEPIVHFTQSNEASIILYTGFKWKNTLADLSIQLFQMPCKAMWLELQSPSSQMIPTNEILQALTGLPGAVKN